MTIPIQYILVFQSIPVVFSITDILLGMPKIPGHHGSNPKTPLIHPFNWYRTLVRTDRHRLLKQSWLQVTNKVHERRSPGERSNTITVSLLRIEQSTATHHGSLQALSGDHQSVQVSGQSTPFGVRDISSRDRLIWASCYGVDVDETVQARSIWGHWLKRHSSQKLHKYTGARQDVVIRLAPNSTHMDTRTIHFVNTPIWGLSGANSVKWHGCTRMVVMK